MKKAFSFLLATVLFITSVFCATFNVFAQVSGDYQYTLDGGKATLTAYTGTETELIIPNKIDGYYIMQIANNAFEGNSILESVIINQDVRGIGDYAFKDCTNLKKVGLPTVSSIGADIFSGCTSFESVCVFGSSSAEAYVMENYPDVTINYHNAMLVSQVESTCITNGYYEYKCQDCGYVYQTPTDFVGHNYVETEVIPPTCYERGYSKYVCSYCGDTQYINSVDALEHNYQTTVVPPNCTEDGYTLHKCIYCGDSYTTDIVASTGNHNYVLTNTVSAGTSGSCGYNVYTCSACGDTYKQPLSQYGHKYSYVETEPTCTEKGYKTYTCSICGYQYITDYVNALGHNYDVTESKAPTCSESGYTKYKCSICGDEYTQTLDMIEHSYETEVFAPSCSARGYTKHTCSVCGNTYNDSYIEKLSHDIYEAEKVNATCTTNGYTIYKCHNCSYEYKTAENQLAFGHNFALVNTQTDSSTGKTMETYRCKNCGDEYTKDITETEHTFNEVTTEPTCIEQGKIVYTCTGCGYSYTELIDLLGHNYTISTDSSLTYDATCTADGKNTYFCTRCNDSYSEVVPKIEHNYVCSGEESLAPTCTADGYDMYVCSLCGDWYKTTIPKTSHNYVLSVESSTLATCTQDGTNSYICSQCSDTYSLPVAELGHKYTPIHYLPTCTEGGYTEYVCSRCSDFYESDEIEPTGHNYSSSVVSPTCVNDGYTVHTCLNCGGTYKDSPTSKLGHSTTTTVSKATMTSNGTSVVTCKRCKAQISKKTILKASSVKISKSKFTYSGKSQRPTISVKNSASSSLVNGRDYSVSYYNSSSKNCGKYTVKVTFKGNYSGTKTFSYYIIPKKMSVSSLVAGRKNFTVKWKKASGSVSGYQVQYSSSSKFKTKKTVTISKSSTVSKKISSLKSKKKYYVRIRAYKTISGTKYYGSWSSVKSVKTK